MVMIESMACGTPVVALSGGAVAEVVQHGTTGLICDHPDQLPDALRHVDQIEPAACRRRVTQHFNTDRLAIGYDTAYRHAITRHHRSHPQPHHDTAPTSTRPDPHHRKTLSLTA